MTIKTVFVQQLSLFKGCFYSEIVPRRDQTCPYHTLLSSLILLHSLQGKVNCQIRRVVELRDLLISTSSISTMRVAVRELVGQGGHLLKVTVGVPSVQS